MEKVINKELEKLNEELSHELNLSSMLKPSRVLFVVPKDEEVTKLTNFLKRNYSFEEFRHITFISTETLGMIDEELLENLKIDWLVLDNFQALDYSGIVLLNLDIMLTLNPHIRVLERNKEDIHQKALEEKAKLERRDSMEMNLEDQAKNNRLTMANSWNMMYELAKAYYNFHHTLDMPRNFKTENGYQPSLSEKAVNLDLWLTLQLVLLRNGKLPYYQSEKLMRLNHHGRNSNSLAYKREIIEKLGIDFELNRELLENISPELLEAKIKFLEENNLPLVDLNGYLQPFFQETSPNLDEQLIEEYYKVKRYVRR